MTDLELLREALEALTYTGPKYIYSDTIDALRARLAQPEQEQMPTKIMGPNLEEVLNAAGFYKQREWVGLTYADLYFWGGELGLGELGKGVLRAVDAHLRKKNHAA